MATTLSTPIKQSCGVWKYEWTGTAPFRVFSYDTYTYILEDTDETSVFVSSGNDIEPPALAVYDSTETTIPDGVTYPSQIVLQWRGYRYAAAYRVEQETAPSTWTEIQNYVEDGSGYYKFTSQVSDDSVEALSFRVVTIDLSGGETDTDIERVVIRNPSPPLCTYTYNAGTGNLTIAAA